MHSKALSTAQFLISPIWYRLFNSWMLENLGTLWRSRLDSWSTCSLRADPTCSRKDRDSTLKLLRWQMSAKNSWVSNDWSPKRRNAILSDTVSDIFMGIGNYSRNKLARRASPEGPSDIIASPELIFFLK